MNIKNALSILGLLIFLGGCSQNASVGIDKKSLPLSSNNVISLPNQLLFDVNALSAINVSSSADGKTVGTVSFVSNASETDTIELLSGGDLFHLDGNKIVITDKTKLLPLVGSTVKVEVKLTDSKNAVFTKDVYIKIENNSGSSSNNTVTFNVSTIPVLDLAHVHIGDNVGLVSFVSAGSTLSSINLIELPNVLSLSGMNINLSSLTGLSAMVNQSISGTVTIIDSLGSTYNQSLSILVIDSSIVAPSASFTASGVASLDTHTLSTGSAVGSVLFSSSNSTLSTIALASFGDIFEIVGNNLVVKYPNNLTPYIGQTIAVNIIGVDSAGHAYSAIINFPVIDTTPAVIGCSLKNETNVNTIKSNLYDLISSKLNNNVKEVALSVYRAMQANSGISMNNSASGILSSLKIFDNAFLSSDPAILTQASDAKTFAQEITDRLFSSIIQNGTNLGSIVSFPLHKNNLCTAASDYANQLNGTTSNPTNYVPDCLSYLGSVQLKIDYSPATSTYKLMADSYNILTFNIVDGILSECALESDFKFEAIADAIVERMIEKGNTLDATNLTAADIKGAARLHFESSDDNDHSSVTASVLERISSQISSNFNGRIAYINTDSILVSHEAQDSSSKIDIVASAGDMRFNDDANNINPSDTIFIKNATGTLHLDKTSDSLNSLSFKSDDGFEVTSINPLTSVTTSDFKVVGFGGNPYPKIDIQVLRDNAPSTNQLANFKNLVVNVDAFTSTSVDSVENSSFQIGLSRFAASKILYDSSINTYSVVQGTIDSSGIISSNVNTLLPDTSIVMSASKMNNMSVEISPTAMNFTVTPQVDSSFLYSIDTVPSGNFAFTSGVTQSGTFNF